MELKELLEKFDQNILSDAVPTILKYRLRHYQGSPDELNKKLALLYDFISKCASERNVIPMVSYAEELAEKRFESGYDLVEVQTAFNVLEECIWKYIIDNIKPPSQAEALSLIASIIGSGKDTLARKYVQLAGQNHN